MTDVPRRAAVPATVAAVVLLVGAPAGFAAYRFDRARLDTLPAGSAVGGVDVSGLGRRQAVAAVAAAIARERERVTELRVAGRVFRTTPHRLGVTDDGRVGG